MIDDLRVRKRRQIRAAAIFTPRAQEAYGPWDNRTDQQLVVESSWSAVFIGIDGDVFFLQTFATVIGTVSSLPVRLLGLGKVPLGGGVEVWSTGLDILEVAMWVPANRLFVVGHLFVVWFRVGLLLLFVGRHHGQISLGWSKVFVMIVVSFNTGSTLSNKARLVII